MNKIIKVKLLKSYKIIEKLTREQLVSLNENGCTLDSVKRYDNLDIIFHVVEYPPEHGREKDFYSLDVSKEFIREDHPYASYIPKCYVSLYSKQIELNFED